ncbi:hypothetical protein [Streptomyces chrestomyceticus]|uniref:hypothetical protein n=1 Tax=Streptomyces chrestomyceticus TaxID=68185 RepID=UPI0033D00A2F
MTTTPAPPSDRATATSGSAAAPRAEAFAIPKQPPRTVSHVVPAAGRDLAYRHDRGEIELPVTVHFTDGTTVQTTLLLDPGQVELFALQTEQAIGRRADAKRAQLLSDD